MESNFPEASSVKRAEPELCARLSDPIPPSSYNSQAVLSGLSPAATVADWFLGQVLVPGFDAFTAFSKAVLLPDWCLEPSCRETAHVASWLFLDVVPLFRILLSKVQNSQGGCDIKIITASLEAFVGCPLLN